jgi:hypothetical protein
MRAKTKFKLISYSALLILVVSLVIWYVLQIPSPRWPTIVAWAVAFMFFVLWKKSKKSVKVGEVKKPKVRRLL